MKPNPNPEPNFNGTQPELPEVRSFTFHWKFRWLIIAGALFFTGFLIFALLLPVIEPNEGIWIVSVLCAAVFGPLTAMTIPVLRGMWDVVSVGPEGIRLQRPKKPEEFLRWSEIAEVRSRDGLQRLEIFDWDGRLRIRIEYQLENFPELDRIIRERTSGRATGREPGEDEVAVFDLGRSVRLLCGIGAIACLAIGGFAWFSDPWAAAAFAGFAVFCLAGILWEPHQIEIHADRLVLCSRLRKNRTIHFRDIIDVQFEYAQIQYGNVTPRIVFVHLRRKPTFLGAFTRGTAKVHEQIRSRWERWLMENR